MNEFFKFYRWGIYMKSHMALYTLALVFAKGVVGFFIGEYTISIWIILEMLIAGLLAAMFEVFCFPEGSDFSGRRLVKKTVAWAVFLNVCFLGGSLWGGWFEGISSGWGLVLVVVLELGIVAMWVGVHVAMKVDTKMLNRGLELFKSDSFNK